MVKKAFWRCAFFCCILLFPGCSYKTQVTEDARTIASGLETAVEALLSYPVTFVYPDIEKKTREILDRPEGVITKVDLLTITEFSMEYEIGINIAMPFLDLQWYRNLECVCLPGCGVESLEGVEKLTALKKLWVRNNYISSIEPVRNMTGLVEFSCSLNPIANHANYELLGGLTNLEVLEIGNSGWAYCDIKFLADLKKLKRLSATYGYILNIAWLSELTDLEYLDLTGNEIWNIGPLENLKNLKTLRLGNNRIYDIHVLENLDQLTSLDLAGNKVADVSAIGKLKQLTDLDIKNNQITDIVPLYNLDKLTDVELWGNEIPEEDVTAFYEERRGEDIRVTQKGRLREDMAEFTFELTASYNLRVKFYEVQSIDVYENGTLLQTVSIPELTLFGQTETLDSMLDTLGFELEDVNFDGYLDIRLFDNLNGTYKKEWVYLVWNPEKQQFEHDARLNEISLASFDQEEQLIYGMERESGSSHYYSTYEYRDGEIVKIRYRAEEWLYLPNEQIKQYYDASSVETEEEEFEAFYEHIIEINEETGQLETVSEEYIFWGIHTWEEKLYIDASSELGKQITEDRTKYF